MTQSTELPKGWAVATLGAIRADRSSNVDPTRSPSESFELYSIPAFPSGQPEIVPGSEIGSTKKSLEPGTVVVSKINPRINRVWIVGEKGRHRQIGSSEWIPFFPVSGLEPRYLAYFLRQDSFRNYLAANVSGVGGSLMRVRPNKLDPHPVVIPPAHEQERIAEAVDSYFTRLDDVVASLERVRRNLQRYRASVLKAAVEGRLVPTEAELASAEGRDYEPASVLLERILAERRRRWEAAELEKMKAKGTAPKNDHWKASYREPAKPDASNMPRLQDGWCWATVDQLEIGDRRCAYGVLIPGPDLPNGVPLLRVGDINGGRIDTTQLKHISREVADKFAKTYLRGGEVLITLVGTIGRTAVVPSRLAGANVARAVGVIPVSDLLDSHWIECWFRSPGTRSRMVGKAHEVARKTLNLEDVRGALVALPPRAEQGRISEAAQDLDSIAESMSSAVTDSTLRCTRLRQAVLKWAFEGKLVDQDPNDEPADVLLQRIQAERANATTKKSRTTGRKKAPAKKS